MNAIAAFNTDTLSSQPHTTVVHGTELPEGVTAAQLAHCDFARQGQDLILTQDDGSSILVKGYFLSDTPADLQTAEGAVFRADWVDRLSTQQNQVAQNGDTASSPIGTVKTLNGTVTVQRADGTEKTLQIGDQVFQDDVIETAGDGSIGITFSDGSDFSLGNDGKMILDEMVYDPATQDGDGNINVLGGTFAFISGQIAKTSPDAMKVTTPSATIGFRGTSGSGEVTGTGETSIVLIRDPDGTIGEIFITTPAGVFTLGDVLQGADIGLDPTAPVVVRTLTPAQFMQKYAAVTTSLPTAHSMQQQGQDFLNQATDPTPQPGEKAGQEDNGEKGNKEGNEGQGDEGDEPPQEGGDETGDGDENLPPEELPPEPEDVITLSGSDEEDIIGIITGDTPVENPFGDIINIVAPPPDPTPPLPIPETELEHTITIGTGTDTPEPVSYIDLASGEHTGTENSDTMNFVNDGVACGTLYGMGGNDILTGGDGCDTIYGGEGNDILQDADSSSNGGRTAGADILYGGAGNDTLILVAGLNNHFYGENHPDDAPPETAGTDTLQFIVGTGEHVEVTLSSHEAKIVDSNESLTASATISDFDVFNLSIGNDQFDGGTGATQGYSIFGHDGNDTIVGSDQRDFIFGGGDNDVLDGAQGNDLVFGQEGDDTLTANQGSDRVVGGGGNDRILLSEGTHMLEGGDDIDTLVLDSMAGDVVSVVLTAGSENATITRSGSTFATTTTLTDFEIYVIGDGTGDVQGSTNADTIINAGGNNSVYGYGGDDVIGLEAGTIATAVGGLGSDTLSFTTATAQVTIDGSNNLAEIVSGSTTLGTANFASDFEIFALSDQADTYSGIDYGATVYGNKGADILTGGTGNDVLHGGNGNDTLRAGAGDDTLFGDDGKDTFIFDYLDGMTNSLNGGAHSDTLQFSIVSTKHAELDMSDPNMIVRIVDGSTTIAQANTSGFERFILTNNNDSFLGGTGDETVIAGAGNDNINTGAGNDVIYIESGTDIVNAGADDDTVYWSDGTPQDTGISLSGGDGAMDILVVTPEAGGQSAINIATGTATLQMTSGSEGATANISDFEIFQLSDGVDTFVGNATDVTVYSGAGNDTFTGGAGSETIYSGAGNDSLTGNGGADYFTFGTKKDTTVIDPDVSGSLRDLGMDTIQDFQIGVDKFGINVSVFADVTTDNIIATTSIDASYGTSEPGIIAYFMDGVTFVHYVPDLTNTATRYQIARVEAAQLQKSDFVLYQTDTPSTPSASAINCANVTDDIKVGSNSDDSMAYASPASVDENTTLYNGTLIGLDGNDTLTGGYGSDVIYGGKGNDTLADANATYNLGDAGKLDTIYGGDGNDVITLSDGLADDDDDGVTQMNHLDGDGYNDVGISGIIEGIDTLQFITSSISDYVSIDLMGGGDNGDVTLYNTDDSVRAQASITNFEIYRMTSGADTFTGNDDSLKGIEVYAGEGNDILTGGGGNDTLRGEDNDDQISGSGGDDLLIGGDGDDILTGGEGADRLVGGAGQNTLNGEGGGSDGADYFVFNVDYTTLTSGDTTYSDTLQNFTTANGDKIALDVDAFGGEIKTGNIIVETDAVLKADYSGLVSDSASGAIILHQVSGDTTLYYVSDVTNATSTEYQYATIESALIGAGDVVTYTNDSELPSAGYDGTTPA